MALRFDPPLILDAASRPAAARWGDALLTGLLWSGWAYLLAASVGTLWVPPFVQHLLPVAPPDRSWDVIRAALVNLIIAAVLCSLMLVRVILERRRFAGEDRRRRFPRPSDQEIAVALGAPAEAFPSWRKARRLVIHHTEAGGVERVETLP